VLADLALAACLLPLLGADEWATRDRAGRVLGGMGVGARPALLVGSRSADAEVRGRCRRDLARRDAEVRDWVCLVARTAAWLGEELWRADQASKP
jgi:hypothetical protein